MNNVKQFLGVFACGLQMIVYVQTLDHIHCIGKVFGLKYTNNYFLTLRAQSRTSNRKTWDRFPSSVGGNSLGNVPEVFVNEVFGNVARTLWESFPCVVRSTLFCWTFFDPSFSIINHNKTSGNTYFKAQLAEGDITKEFG